MKIKVLVYENQPPFEAVAWNEVQKIMAIATIEAQKAGMLNIVFFLASNGNKLSLVVGGTETVVGFANGNSESPYYASKGTQDDKSSIMTAYVSLRHHTEFSRRYVIPFESGVCAVKEFCTTGLLPHKMEWLEI